MRKKKKKRLGLIFALLLMILSVLIFLRSWRFLSEGHMATEDVITQSMPSTPSVSSTPEDERDDSDRPVLQASDVQPEEQSILEELSLDETPTQDSESNPVIASAPQGGNELPDVPFP